jgi:protein-disulfide isomerase
MAHEGPLFLLSGGQRMLRTLFAVVLSLFAFAASAQTLESVYRIAAEDGSPVANHAVPGELVNAIEKMPGIVVVGNPRGDVTLVEFYDLNCPYCRRASTEIDALVKADKGLRLVLVPFPVLGIPSILGGRVELAVAKIGTAAQFYAFHRKVYAGRGVIDGDRALAAARNIGIDEKKILAIANDDTITETMKAHVKLGNALKIVATPGFVIGGAAIIGYPGRKSLEAVIASVRACAKPACG